jgi:hypothetical protein
MGKEIGEVRLDRIASIVEGIGEVVKCIHLQLLISVIVEDRGDRDLSQQWQHTLPTHSTARTNANRWDTRKMVHQHPH